MKTHKTIPFYILLIRSLAKDFEKKDFTWRELYDILFVEGTDIYREFVVTLVNSGINLNSKVNYKKTVDETESSVVYFEEDEERRMIRNTTYDEEFKIPKSVTINVMLGKLGFIKVKKPNKNTKAT